MLSALLRILHRLVDLVAEQIISVNTVNGKVSFSIDFKQLKKHIDSNAITA